MKVREGLARDDYKDPGWYKHPDGTVAYEVASAAVPPAHARRAGSERTAKSRDINVVKPGSKSGHKGIIDR